MSCPQEFVQYFQYVRSLRFEDKPDYAYLRRLFRDLFAKEGERGVNVVCVQGHGSRILDVCSATKTQLISHMKSKES